VACLIATPYSQRIGDVVAGTLLIDTRNRTSWEDTIFTELTDNYQPRYPQVMQLSDKDINTLKGIINSVRKKSDYDLSIRIAARIRSKLQIEDDQDSLDFLQTLLGIIIITPHGKHLTLEYRPQAYDEAYQNAEDHQGKGNDQHDTQYFEVNAQAVEPHVDLQGIGTLNPLIDGYSKPVQEIIDDAAKYCRDQDAGQGITRTDISAEAKPFGLQGIILMPEDRYDQGYDVTGEGAQRNDLRPEGDLPELLPRIGIE
jgi:hypothetical protein